VEFAARHGAPQKTASQIAIPANIDGKFVQTQGLTVADNDEELPVTLSIMKRTLGFPVATLLVTFQRSVYPVMTASSQGAHRKN